jgi:hypothetical protein
MDDAGTTPGQFLEKSNAGRRRDLFFTVFIAAGMIAVFVRMILQVFNLAGGPPIELTDCLLLWLLFRRVYSDYRGVP